MNQTKRIAETESTAAAGSDQPVISRRRRLVAMLMTMAGTLVIGLLGLEIVLRLFVSVTDVPFVFWDPVVGLRRAPNQAGRAIFGQHIDARYRFNAQGWNHPKEYTTEKPEGTTRIALIGDSQVEAIQVDVDKNMACVAQDLMHRPDRKLQWYTFGSSGLGTAQEYEVVRHYALDYHPDVVVLLFIQNDPFDCSPYIVNLPNFLPTYYLDSRGELALVPATEWKPRFWRRLSAKFALPRYFIVQRRVLDRIKRWTEPKRPFVGGLPLREEAGNASLARIPDLNSTTLAQREEKTWQLIEALFEAARDACRRRGAVFAVAFRGWPPEIEGPIQQQTDSTAEQKADPYCLESRFSEMGREWVGPIAEKLGIPYLDLTDAIRSEVERSGQSHRFPDDNHFSEVGHRAAGRAMAEWVEAILHDTGGAPGGGLEVNVNIPYPTRSEPFVKTSWRRDSSYR